MSRENVEIVRIGYQRYLATGEFTDEIVTPDFVWDMSNFHGWPEQQVYVGADGARTFLKDWTDCVGGLGTRGGRPPRRRGQSACSPAPAWPVESERDAR